MLSENRYFLSTPRIFTHAVAEFFFSLPCMNSSKFKGSDRRIIEGGRFPPLRGKKKEEKITSWSRAWH